ncbi:hypothetical protein CWS01_11360 [Niallia nealsonii]|uniref:Uncharacterized protein n=1 Tax=Niallia nealsonii TaxID=115979 RepID=A0A2N0Z250_9BACI|nr:hypothetical protein CWS01_11360 [Niallia nealsonii]
MTPTSRLKEETKNLGRQKLPRKSRIGSTKDNCENKLLKKDKSERKEFVFSFGCFLKNDFFFG